MKNKIVTGVFQSKHCLEKAKIELMDTSITSNEDFSLDDETIDNCIYFDRDKNKVTNNSSYDFVLYTFLGVISAGIALLGLFFLWSPYSNELNVFSFITCGAVGALVGFEIIKYLEKNIDKPYQSTNTLIVVARNAYEIMKAKEILFKYNALNISAAA